MTCHTSPSDLKTAVRGARRQEKGSFAAKSWHQSGYWTLSPVQIPFGPFSHFHAPFPQILGSLTSKHLQLSSKSYPRATGGSGPALTPEVPAHLQLTMGFPSGSYGKESAYSAGDPGLIPGLWGSPGKGNGNPLQYSCLENPMDREAWWAIQSMGLQRVGHDRATNKWTFLMGFLTVQA